MSDQGYQLMYIVQNAKREFSFMVDKLYLAVWHDLSVKLLLKGKL
jgi:hypothetical protein